MQRIDWFEVGKPYWFGKEKEIEEILRKIEWKELPCKMAMSPGLAIEETIKTLELPNVTHVADSNAMAPFGILAMRAHFKNADVELFGVDEGSSLCMLCAFVEEK